MAMQKENKKQHFQFSSCLGTSSTFIFYSSEKNISPPIDDFRFLMFVKLKKKIWQCSQSFDLNLTCEMSR